MFEIDPPRDTAALRRGLSGLHREIVDAMAGFSDDAFFAPQGEHWAPAGHVRHLAKSVRPVAQAMELPKLLLRLRFGGARRGSRRFEEIVELYRESLASGRAQAGAFGPSSTSSDLPPTEWRAQIMDRFVDAGRRLDAAIAGWGEKPLDRLRLPHPILGPMTVREMLYFTLYHNAHHARRVRERTDR